MKTFKIHLISLLALLTIATQAFGEIAVIVHPDNAVIMSNTAISQLFLGKISSFPGGGKAIPLVLKRGNNTRTAFNEMVLGKSENQYKAFWARLVFTGKATPPKELEDSGKIRDLVAKNPALIGYVDAGDVDASVKVIAKF